MDDNILKRQQLEALLLAAQAETRAADTKAGLLLAAIGVGGGAFLSSILSSTWSPSKLGIFAMICWWAGAASFSASIGLLGSAIFPRYSSRRLGKSPATIFFGHAAQMASGHELLRRLATSSTFLPALSNEVVNAARIARIKYRYIRAALSSAGAGAILMIASAILSI